MGRGSAVTVAEHILLFPSAPLTVSARGDLVRLSQTHQAEPTLALAPAQTS